MEIKDYAIALRKVLRWSRGDWEKVTARTRYRLRDDAKKGILQTGKFKYKSQDYVRRKKRRFNTKQGRKEKSYRGVSVKSNYVANVNMMVTGQLYAGLRLGRTTKNRAIMKYATKDRKKLEGNPEYRVNELSEDSIIYTSKPLDQAIRQKFSRLGKMRIKQKVQVM